MRTKSLSHTGSTRNSNARNCGYRIVMGKSIRIDSHSRIVMKKFRVDVAGDVCASVIMWSRPLHSDRAWRNVQRAELVWTACLVYRLIIPRSRSSWRLFQGHK